MANTFLYFGYGSNMLTSRLRAQTPSANPEGIGFVEGHRLTFDKVSLDGSGKCDIEETGNPADRVFRIASTEAVALDKAEGSGYRKGDLQVVTPSPSPPIERKLTHAL
jgi:gamma-glutamylcyclotransferase